MTDSRPKINAVDFISSRLPRNGMPVKYHYKKWDTTLQQLLEVSRFEEEWAEGYEAPEFDSCWSALQLLSVLAETRIAPPEIVTATAGGKVYLIWRMADERQLSIEIVAWKKGHGDIQGRLNGVRQPAEFTT